MSIAALGPQPKAKNVQAVDRTLAILEALAEHRAPLPLSSLAREVGLNVSTVHRLLHTLMGRGFVYQDAESGRYRLGLKVFEIGAAALAAMDVRQAGRPILEEIVRNCNETANLVVIEGTEVIYIDQVESTRQVKMLAKIGGRAPAFCTGAGKALLASFPEPERERVLASSDLHRFTAATIFDRDGLNREFQKIRNRGYAVDMEEMEDGVRCVAAAVRSSSGRAVAAVSVSGPSSRLSDEYLEAKLIPVVKGGAQRLSARMGYSGEL